MQESFKVARVFCEWMENPMGIDVPRPRFSWVSTHYRRGRRQSAYQVIVASEVDLLNEEKADFWNSGRVISENSFCIYAGRNLQSEKEYYWRVKVWDDLGFCSQWSSIGSFEMGLLNPGDWVARWIVSPDREEIAPLFRKVFHIEKSVRRGRIYVAGLGYCEVWLNGKRVGDRVLDPGWTDYEKIILYTVYDVTSFLQKGENVVGVILGHGRFSPSEKVVKKSPNPLKKYSEVPTLILQLHIEFNDGSKMIVLSDGSWKASRSPILFNDIYDGEVYDARLEEEGWSEPGFDDTKWYFAEENDMPPRGKLLSGMLCPPIKRNGAIQPERMLSPCPGVFVFDFGQNFSGWIRLRVCGPRGKEIRIRYSELLDSKGGINTLPNRGALATDVYILKGEGLEIFEPRFTYHGFRFVEITGFPGVPRLEDVEGIVVHSAVEPRSHFITSHPLVSRIHSNILWSQKSNLMSIPTDCPQREERMGWLGDAHLVAEEACFNFQMINFYRKWFQDMRVAQNEDGSLPDVVPPYWSLYPADPVWGTACVIIPWIVYLYFGDKRVLEENYPMMRKWVDFLCAFYREGVFEFGKYGDWCPPWHVGSIETPPELVSHWYFYQALLLLSRVATILGDGESAKQYVKRAKKVGEDFNHAFLKEDGYGIEQKEWWERISGPLGVLDSEKKKRLKRNFGVWSQTANVLALAGGLAPPRVQRKIVQRLIEDITVTHGGHLNTGIVGTKYILDVLTEFGHLETAFQLLVQDSYPSWGYMIKEGATTLWERWEKLTGEGMNSQNHVMFGSIDAWLYKYLLGIQPDPENPGFKHCVIKPHLPRDIDFVSGFVATPFGELEVSWQKVADGLLHIWIGLPFNTTATVYFPKLFPSDYMEIFENDKKIWTKRDSCVNSEEMVFLEEEERYIVFQIGSGSYFFKVYRVKE
jgi:alpha-L-rhamnosidase